MASEPPPPEPDARAVACRLLARLVMRVMIAFSLVHILVLLWEWVLRPQADWIRVGLLWVPPDFAEPGLPLVLALGAAGLVGVLAGVFVGSKIWRRPV